MTEPGPPTVHVDVSDWNCPEDAVYDRDLKDDQHRPIRDRGGTITGYKRRTPNEAMEAAREAVAAGEASGRYLIRTRPDPERQAEMLKLNIGNH